MAAIWEPENKLRKWLEIEVLAAEAYAELGMVPREAAKAIRERAAFSVERTEQIEETTRHDVIAFLTNVAENVGEESRYIHLGLTSSDVLDTGFALQLREAADLILADLDELMATLRERAWEQRDTPMIGRSHGIHAEPITFGLKLALWHEEMGRAQERVRRAREAVSFGKLSGAVGTYADVPPEVEAYVLSRLGLKAETVSTQVVQRDRHAEYFGALAVTASSIERIATEVRHLHRTEVLEVEEYFAPGQKGSSAMPHKRNPILAENLCGLARLVRANALAALENVALWHERDISHSSVERVIGPDSTILLDFMLARLTGLIRNLVVYPERMKANLDLTRGLIFSPRVMLALVERGMLRERAYEVVQRSAMRAWRREGDFAALLTADEEVRAKLSAAELEGLFDLAYYLKHVGMIMSRVFAGHNPERDRLRRLLAERSYERREVTLTSGRVSDFYIDAKQTSLTAEGAWLCGRLLLEEVRLLPGPVQAVGGLTLGADPLVVAVAVASRIEGEPLDAFIIRQEPKGHGTGTWLEGAGRLPAGARVALLEDVVTTGGSVLRAAERCEAHGLKVAGVVALVDRQEGGAEAVAQKYPFRALFRREDFLEGTHA
jgi:adenylosuccinate lyase